MRTPADPMADGRNSVAAVSDNIAQANPDQHSENGHPTIASPNLEAVPLGLRTEPVWVLWRYERRDGKWTKVPYQADLKTRARSNDPDTWITLDEAAATLAPEWGLGVMFHDRSDVMGVDIDDARDPVTGELSPEAHDIVTTLGSYTEVSPSGEGVHILVRASLDGLKGRRRGNVEMYESGRFFTFTGHNTVEGTPADVLDRTDQLATIHARYVAPPERLQAPRSAPSGLDVRHEDHAVLDAMWRSANASKIRALWDGDTSAHGDDHSAADQALAVHLAWWTNYNPDGQADRLFRASGLMREKWNRVHYGDRRTYGQGTIDTAFEGRKPGDGYQGRRPRNVAPTPPQREPDSYHMGTRSDDPGDDWPAWQPIPDGLPAAPKLDPDLLPEPLSRWAFDTAERANIPPDVMVPGIIVGLSIMVGNRWRIQPKRHDTWTVVPNTWGAIVQPAGTLKTHALNTAMRPVHRIEAAMLERHELERLGREVDAEVARARVDALTLELKKHASGKIDRSLDEIRADLIEAKRDAERQDTRPPILTVQDATPERIVEIAEDNPRGVGLPIDELYGWHMSLQKQGREDARAMYLTGHDGGQPYRQARVNKSADRYVPVLTISIVGTIQPSRLRIMQAGAISGEDADGLLQRFQVIAWPEPLPTYRLVDREPDSDLEAQVATIYERLYDLDPANFGAADGQPGIVHFDDAAQDLFYDWLAHLEGERLRDPELQSAPEWASFLGKERGLMPTLALLLHLVDFVTARAKDMRVSLSAAQRAADLTAYLEGHAAKVYGPELARDHVAAQLLADRIRDGALEGDDQADGDTVRVKWLKDRNWSGLGPESVESALAVLDRHGWLRVVKVSPDGGTGRPRRMVQLRPDLDEYLGGAS